MSDSKRRSILQLSFTNQSDYLQKISAVCMESPSQTKTRHNPENAKEITKQNTPGPASEHPTAQTDYSGSGHWQEELYQMIKALKDQYLPELSDLCNKISMKLQHIDNHMPAQKLTEQYEKMKSFKLMVERTMWFLQIEKNCVQLALKDKIPVYERQIVNIINSQKQKPVRAFQQSAGQSPSSNTSRIPVDSTAQSDYTGAGNWQEDLYQMIKTMKNQYLPRLSDLCNKVSMKLQHIDNHMPAQKLSEQYEKMKNFKLFLERTLQFLKVDKSSIKPTLKDKIPVYERQIVCILELQKRKLVQTFEKSTGQTASCNTSKTPVDSAAQTGYPGAGDLHEELFQMNMTLKNQYLAGLSDLCEISMKLQTDSNTPPRKPTNQCEKMNNFKLMLERSLHSLQNGKSSVHPDAEESIPIYKRQITSILNSEGWKSERTLQQYSGQAPSTGFSTEPSPERSNVKRLRPYLKDDIRT